VHTVWLSAAELENVKKRHPRRCPLPAFLLALPLPVENALVTLISPSEFILVPTSLEYNVILVATDGQPNNQQRSTSKLATAKTRQ
jgi:hypothetical protein